MDYKSRNLILPRWSCDHVDTMRNPMPYARSCLTDIMELDAPDRSTTFLVFYGHGLLDEEITFWYLVEAPRDCIMRRAFETGEISMEDFWDHKGWLIQMETILMATSDPVIKYIHPTQMDAASRANLQSLNGRSPYEHMIDRLTSLLKFRKDQGVDISDYQAQIDDVIRHMPHREFKKSA